MEIVPAVMLIVGLAISASGFIYAFRLRSKGGVPVNSGPWYLVVFLTSGGIGIAVASIGTIFY